MALQEYFDTFITRWKHDTESVKRKISSLSYVLWRKMNLYILHFFSLD